MGQEDTGPAALERAEEVFEFSRSRLNAAKIAFLNRTQLEGKDVDYAALKQIAQETIEAHYDLQRLRFGKVKLKLSVAKLLRRGW